MSTITPHLVAPFVDSSKTHEYQWFSILTCHTKANSLPTMIHYKGLWSGNLGEVDIPKGTTIVNGVVFLEFRDPSGLFREVSLSNLRIQKWIFPFVEEYRFLRQTFSIVNFHPLYRGEIQTQLIPYEVTDLAKLDVPRDTAVVLAMNFLEFGGRDGGRALTGVIHKALPLEWDFRIKN